MNDNVGRVKATSTLPTLLELDERRRTSLNKIGQSQHRRYLVTENPDGSILLSPAVVMSELEARFQSDPALMADIEHRRTSTKRVRRTL